ncbi:hypothetical protein [Staphylococcus caeli]|uniref:Lytic regulatory protein n=1 Tax=Staphylococcus caeli TaxID=2201815 RepID=A0A1D4QMY5_9STAP|nr:hypothetical protein [Staphylococcus caeli]SCT32956.1 lytic regulatory protein [Staphylococcus caeli]SCT36604.1 lytic regulatory protein [Staphylococcus caeli]
MFNFHKLALSNAKPQNAKILLFTIVSFIILFALTVLTFMPVQLAMYKVMVASAMQQPMGGIIFLVVLAILIPILVFVLVGYPLIAGTIYTIDNAINKDKSTFSDLFSIFKKGKYLKAIKLALITLIFILLLLVLNILVSKVLNLGLVQLFSALQGPLSSTDHALGYSLTLQIVAATLILFIQSFLYWFFAILIVNYTLAFVKEPSNGAWTSVKRGFKGIKNGKKTWFKFYLGLLLLNLIVIILANPVSQLVSIFTGSISQTVALTIINIVTIIVIIIRLAIYYINLLAIIQYYNRDGEKIENAQTKSKSSRSKASKVKNSVKHDTEKSKSTTHDKAEHLKAEASKTKDSITKQDK